MSTTPDEIIASRIAEELVLQGLLSPDRVGRFVEDLATGRLKAGDWNLLADLPRGNGAEAENGK